MIWLVDTHPADTLVLVLHMLFCNIRPALQVFTGLLDVCEHTNYYLQAMDLLI